MTLFAAIVVIVTGEGNGIGRAKARLFIEEGASVIVVDRDSAFVRGLREAAAAHHDGEPMSVGRDGASDAVSFLRVGVPAVEFGPSGEGHHGPSEWVSLPSLIAYRQALEAFLHEIPDRLDA